MLSTLTFGLFQFCVVRQGEIRIIERRGRFVRVAQPGVHMLFSAWGTFDSIGRFRLSQVFKDPKTGRSFVAQRGWVEALSTRMQVDDYPQESIITRDKATVSIDAVVYYRILDPQKAVYEVQDYVAALQKLVQSALRDEAGKYELDELLVSRDTINSSLRASLDEATDPWGIKVDRVELKDIDLGAFGNILAEQRGAETKRRTEITEAEGLKRAAILKAEGLSESSVLEAKANKEATILNAEASKRATILHAEAEAESILKVFEAEARGYALLHKVFGGDSEQVIRTLKIQKAAEVSDRLAHGHATKMFLPADISTLFGLAADKLGK